ncbi:hypothetical protein HJG43_10695 [Kineosporiaceae bacterium SCSIO 59966]|jgi:hypothetical protein|nr:hypothetical protein HJG43_10695 [Kineosporiaceae bacterium SCSIO 59966]
MTIRLLQRVRAVRAAGLDGDRGDVPGWVLVTLMTAGLVIGIWAVAGDALEQVFTEAMNRVLGF